MRGPQIASAGWGGCIYPLRRSSVATARLMALTSLLDKLEDRGPSPMLYL